MSINTPNNPKTIESMEVIDQEDSRSQEAYALLRRSGDKCKPLGMEYVGSAAFHMYKDKHDGLLPPSYVFVTLSPIGEATEGMCIMGFKRLKSRIYQFFGRKEAEWRK